MKRLVFNDITKELDFVEQGQEELFEGVKELDVEGGEGDKKEQSKIKNMLKTIVSSFKIKVILYYSPNEFVVVKSYITP